jgi:hypothetical protein
MEAMVDDLAMAFEHWCSAEDHQVLQESSYPEQKSLTTYRYHLSATQELLG